MPKPVSPDLAKPDSKPGTPPPPARPTPPAASAPAAGAQRYAHLALPLAGGAALLSLIALGVVVSRQPPALPTGRIEALEQRLAALQPLDGRLGALETALREQGGATRAAQEAAQQAAARAGEAAQAGEANRAALAQAQQAVQGLRGQVESQRSDREALSRAAEARIEEAERAMSQRITGAEAQLAQRVAAAEAALGPRFAAVETTMQQRIAATEEAARQRMAERDRALDQRFAALEQRETRLASAERRLAQLIATTATTTALEAGRPLGRALAGLPGEAPAPLRRYAEAAPPTEASLRLSFDEAARAARARAEPATEGQGIWESAATRLSNLVTVRRGEQVVWGDAISGEVENARRSLEAGDLAAAVRRIEALPEGPRGAMEGWLDQARGLLAARAALEELRAGGQG